MDDGRWTMATDDGRVKVLSYNIWEGGGERLPTIAAVIREAQPDAVALLEANSRAHADALARDLAMDLAFGEAWGAFHIAWLSRLPIRRAANHRLAGLAKTLLEIEVAAAGGPLRLFATHLASRHEPQPPEAEIGVILEVLAPLVGTPHLLVGDFNALAPGDPVGTPSAGRAPWGEALDAAPRPAITRLLAAGYLDCYRARHPGVPGYTYPAAAPWLRIDYLFASPPLAARLQAADLICGAVAAQGSDHLPVWAAFGATEIGAV